MRSLALAALAVLVLACGQPPAPAADASPTPTVSAISSPTPDRGATPIPSTQPYAVLATSPYAKGGAAASYTISLVSSDGKVAATTTALGRSGLTCPNDGQVILPRVEVSATEDRVYFLDGNTTVRWLAPDGSDGTANAVPGGGSIASTFAVSPDDKRVAVVSADYSQSPIPYRIYVEDIAGGNRSQIFSSSGSTVPWAAGWHQGQLVLGYGSHCIPRAAGGEPWSDQPLELHVVDPDTAVRSATLGGSNCAVRSSPSPAGIVCEELAASSPTYRLVGWNGSTRQTFQLADEAFSMALSPGGLVAGCCSITNQVLLTSVSSTRPVGSSAFIAQNLGFIDDDHLLLGGETQQEQPRILVLTANSALPLNALGEFVGRIPGAL